MFAARTVMLLALDVHANPDALQAALGIVLAALGEVMPLAADGSPWCPSEEQCRQLGEVLKVRPLDEDAMREWFREACE